MQFIDIPIYDLLLNYNRSERGRDATLRGASLDDFGNNPQLARVPGRK